MHGGSHEFSNDVSGGHCSRELSESEHPEVQSSITIGFLFSAFIATVCIYMYIYIYVYFV